MALDLREIMNKVHGTAANSLPEGKTSARGL
jgi:hypothetical protein